MNSDWYIRARGACEQFVLGSQSLDIPLSPTRYHFFMFSQTCFESTVPFPFPILRPPYVYTRTLTPIFPTHRTLSTKQNAISPHIPSIPHPQSPTDSLRIHRTRRRGRWLDHNGSLEPRVRGEGWGKVLVMKRRIGQGCRDTRMGMGMGTRRDRDRDRELGVGSGTGLAKEYYL